MLNRFKLVVTVHLILIKDNKILLLRRFNTGYEDGKYSVPAGHLDGNETIRKAMIREAKEEIDIDIKPEDLEIVHVMHRKSNDERIDFFLKSKKWEGKIKNKESDKCDDLRWFELKKLPQNLIPYVRTAIIYVKNKTFFSEFGW